MSFLEYAKFSSLKEGGRFTIYVTQVVELFCTHSRRRHMTPILPLIVYL